MQSTVPHARLPQFNTLGINEMNEETEEAEVEVEVEADADAEVEVESEAKVDAEAGGTNDAAVARG